MDDALGDIFVMVHANTETMFQGVNDIIENLTGTPWYRRTVIEWARDELAQTKEIDGEVWFRL